MGSNRNNSRLLERVWSFMNTHQDCMRADTLYNHLQAMYGDDAVRSQQTMTQTLIRSGLFRRVSWLNTKTGKEHITSLPFSSLEGIPSTNLVVVLEARKMEEICEPYLDPTRSPLRRLDRMPAFVRRGVDLLSEGGQV